jgi:urease subunit gamma/beta
MHLTPRERERLLLAAAADLARRRLARGAPLGATEAVALVCDEVCELAWDGVALDEVISRARAVVAPSALLPGVAALVPVIEVEALFPWGSTLVHVDRPFGPPAAADGGGDGDRAGAERGRLARAAPGDTSAAYPPGAVLAVDGDIVLAAGLERRTVLLRNTGSRDVWISSHFPLDQVNPAVEVHGGGGRCRLDLPAGEALLLRAGEEHEAVVVVTVR